MRELLIYWVVFAYLIAPFVGPLVGVFVKRGGR